MARGEVHVEHLVGRRVLARNNRPIGRLQEIVGEHRRGGFVVTEYHVGAYAAFERLSAWRIGRAVLSLFGATGDKGGYRVPWDKLDVSNPKHPRLTCEISELRPLRP